MPFILGWHRVGQNTRLLVPRHADRLCTPLIYGHNIHATQSSAWPDAATRPKSFGRNWIDALEFRWSLPFRRGENRLRTSPECYGMLGSTHFAIRFLRQRCVILGVAAFISGAAFNARAQAITTPSPQSASPPNPNAAAVGRG